MKLSFEHNAAQYHCDTDDARSIAIELDFDGAQPNHFGAPTANRQILKLGGFVGDTTTGGSCNVDVVELIPHCNGTHTETVSHIVSEDIWIGHVAVNPIMLAALVTVETTAAKDCGENYRPALDDVDTVITSGELENAMQKFASAKPVALIIRTRPNPTDKRSRSYGAGGGKFQPAFFTVEAMNVIVKSGVRHLLVDLPSVDRMYDDGLLTNHHLFWKVKENSHELGAETEQDKTISEMIYVDDEIADGLFALSLQFPAFSSDAAPSRPIVMPLN